MGTLTCRQALHADDDDVAAMMVSLYVEDPSPHGMTDAKARRTLATLAREPVRGNIAVLEVDGATAGYSMLSSFLSNELGGVICVVDELYVKAAFRGRGVASWFVGELRAGRTPWFHEAVALELEVTPDNVRARALYERLGFRAKKNTTLRVVLD